MLISLCFSSMDAFALMYVVYFHGETPMYCAVRSGFRNNHSPGNVCVLKPRSKSSSQRKASAQCPRDKHQGQRLYSMAKERRSRGLARELTSKPADWGVTDRGEEGQGRLIKGRDMYVPSGKRGRPSRRWTLPLLASLLVFTVTVAHK